MTRGWRIRGQPFSDSAILDRNAAIAARVLVCCRKRARFGDPVGFDTGTPLSGNTGALEQPDPTPATPVAGFDFWSQEAQESGDESSPAEEPEAEPAGPWKPRQ